MARKAVIDGGKKEEIISAAQECFFEKGYDGTTIRGIMKKAGAEVGLFYYYFGSKDAIFDQVLDRFFLHYKKSAAGIVEAARRDPFRGMNNLFGYLERETQLFREKYATNMHRTVRWAIREYTLMSLVPYVRQLLDIIVAMGAQLKLSMEVTAIMMAHGVGSVIIHKDKDWMEKNEESVRRASTLITGLNIEMSELIFPYFAGEKDIAHITALAEEMQEYFPGFCRNEFEAGLRTGVHAREVLVIRNQGKVVGCIAFSRRNAEITFLAVPQEWRGCGIAARLFITATAQFPVGTELSVVTFRDGDTLGADARWFYGRMGFEERELLTLFGYPCQRFVMKVPEDCLFWRQDGKEQEEKEE